MNSRSHIRIQLALATIVFAGAASVSWLSVFDRASEADVTGSLVHVLNRGINGEPESLNPRNFQSNQAATVLRDIGEGLVAYSPNGEITGAVASSWGASPDGLTFTFYIRDDARWSNGTAVEADHFVRAFRNLADPKHAANNTLVVRPIKNAEKILRGEAPVDRLGVAAIEANKLVIELQSPMSTFIQLLAHPSAFPALSRGSAEKLEFEELSNGAYILSDRILGSEIKLIRNNQYWNAKNVKFDIVRYHIVEETVELSRFRAGELDITGNVPAGVFNSTMRDFPNNLEVAPYLGIYYYGFNLEHDMFKNNLQLRSALNLAIDRNILVGKVLGRGELAAFSWVPPGVSGYTPNRFEWEHLPRADRIRLAMNSFKQSGYESGKSLSITLMYNTSDVQHRIALAVASMWKEVLGIEVELVNREFRVMLDEIRSDPAVEMFRLSWTGDYNDAEAFLQIFESDNPSNFTRYKNAEFDNALRLARAEQDPRQRAEFLSRAEVILLKDVAVVPLYFYVSKHLVSDKVAGWTPNVLDIHQSQHLEPKPL